MNVWGGADWGQLLWGGLTAVPVMHGVGLMALSALLVGVGVFVMRHRDAGSPSQRLAVGNFLRFGALLLLLLAPPVAYATSVTLPHIFQNGTLAEADEMNANFMAVSTAVNDNDSRLDTLLNQSCSAGEVATGVGAAGNLLCAPPP
jgi:hypothetical protein